MATGSLGGGWQSLVVCFFLEAKREEPGISSSRGTSIPALGAGKGNVGVGDWVDQA